VSYNRGIMGLRGYTNGGPTGDPWPISGTPTEWTPVRELLRLPLYQAHPLRLREGLRR